MPFMPRPMHRWRLRTRSVELGARTWIMGILNVTPDSFSDGGRFFPQKAAVDHALRMLDEGADLVDIGGESTRPTATPVTPAEEQARILPVIRAVLVARPAAILSIDTYHAETARAAIDLGTEIVNDVSGHLWDSAMSAACAQLACGNVLMHTRGRPSEWKTQPRLAPHEVVPLVLHDLRVRIDAALAAGIARDSIVLDPGFGFGKIMDENWPLLAGFGELQALGYPLLAGLSRKNFLAPGSRSSSDKQEMPSSRVQSRSDEVEGPPHFSTGAPFTGDSQGAREWEEKSATAPQPALNLPKGLHSETWEKDLATSAANMAAILAGAHILRVHEVAPARQVAALADCLLAAAVSSQS